jgi:uncharacterized membrane protein
MEPQLMPPLTPQAPTIEPLQPPALQDRSDQFSSPFLGREFGQGFRSDRFSSQGFDDMPPMFFQGSMHNGGFDMFGTLLFLALLFVMARFFFGGMPHAAWNTGSGRGWQGMKQMRRGWGQDDALELARMRFAKGEISSEEFEMIQRALKD